MMMLMTSRGMSSIIRYECCCFYIVITNDIIFTFATIRVILENFHDDDET